MPISDEKRAPEGAEKTLKAKLNSVNGVKQSGYGMCADRPTECAAAVTVKMFGRDMVQLSVLDMKIAHEIEHYGNVLVEDLALKGLVPRSSETRPAPRWCCASTTRPTASRRTGPDGGKIAMRLDLGITMATEPITAVSCRA